MIEMIEPTTPATPTQGVFMDNFQAPNLVGIIMQALEQHTDAYDHEKYDEMVGIIEDSGLDDLEEKVKDVMRNVSITLDL